MNREPGSQWKDWVNSVALTGGLLLGGAVGTLVNSTFFSGAGIAVQLAAWTTASLGCGGAAVLVTAVRLRRADSDQ